MSRNAPLFSVVTVTLNSARSLERTLASVRAQRFRDFEYLVVDGGSTDGTLALLDREGDLVTRRTSEPDRGISDAFNKGVAMARGRYLGFLNADDWYEPDALERAAAALEDTTDVLCGLQRYWDGERAITTYGARPELLRSFMSVNHIASFCRRTLFAAHGGFKLEYRAAMDYELYLRFFQRGARFGVVDEVLANMSLGGVSDRRWRLALEEVRRAQLENGIALPAAWSSYLFQLAKGSARRGLERAGAESLVKAYRERLSRVRRALR